jgi:dihydrolipoamide dehydrogenase
MAADLGLEVTLIDVEENPGGTCLYRGCIPSKALLHVAKLINDARDAGHCGLTFGPPEIDLNKVRESTQETVAKMTGGLGQLRDARKVKYIQGMASLASPKAIDILSADGERTRLNAEYIILATGSRPNMLNPIIDSPKIMNSSRALQLEDVPENLLIVGGGYIGLELGTVYAALGSKITVVEMTNELLPGADRDLVRPLAERLDKEFHKILLETSVAKMTEQKNGVKVALKSGDKKEVKRIFDKVIVSIGRKPNSSGIGLNNTHVKTDKRGFIEVDEQRRTAESNIFAIGDLTDGPMLAHKASAEGRVAAEVISGKNVAFNPAAIPAVVFTDPEIAWCGMTENQAKESGRKISISRFPWAASGRAQTMNGGNGVTKLIFDTESSQLLGVGIVGACAGELIAEGALAIEMGALAEDLDLTIHPHPTLSETIMESAGALSGTSTHIYRPKNR